MAFIDTEFLRKCIGQVEKSYSVLKTLNKDDDLYDITRNSLIKSFEMTLEQSGKLLKKKLYPFFSSKQEIDRLTFKDIFRSALRCSLLTEQETNRWLIYRDNRNSTAHNYGESFANDTLLLMDDFIKDTKRLKEILDEDR